MDNDRLFDIKHTKVILIPEFTLLFMMFLMKIINIYNILL